MSLTATTPLTGTLDPRTGAHGDLIPVAIRLMCDVVDIIDRLGQPCHSYTVPTARAAGLGRAEGPLLSGHSPLRLAALACLE